MKGGIHEAHTERIQKGNAQIQQEDTDVWREQAQRILSKCGAPPEDQEQILGMAGGQPGAQSILVILTGDDETSELQRSRKGNLSADAYAELLLIKRFLQDWLGSL